MSHTKFRFLTGDVNWKEYGGKFISQKFNNGDFDYWLVLEVMNWEDATGKLGPGKSRYCVTLSVVAPSEVNDKECQRAFDFYGIKDERKDIANDLLVEVFHSYGTTSTVWEGNGNNIEHLMRAARKEADITNMLFGFVMDRPINALGSNGWDFVKGNPSAGLDRWVEKQKKKREEDDPYQNDPYQNDDRIGY